MFYIYCNTGVDREIKIGKFKSGIQGLRQVKSQKIAFHSTLIQQFDWVWEGGQIPLTPQIQLPDPTHTLKIWVVKAI